MSSAILQHLEPHQRLSAAACERCGYETCQDALKFLTELAEMKKKEVGE